MSQSTNPLAHLSPKWQARIKQMVADQKPQAKNWDLDLSGFDDADVQAAKAWVERRERIRPKPGDTIRFTYSYATLSPYSLPPAQQQIVELFYRPT